MKLAQILILALLASTLILAGIPAAGDVSLRIRDSQLKPVSGANVTIAYVDSTNGTIEHRTEFLTSDQSGFAHKNMIIDLNSDYTVTISIHGAVQQINSTWQGVLDRFVNLPLSSFTVRVVDTQGNPITNTPVIVDAPYGNFSEITDSTGFAVFTQYNNQIACEVHVLYGGADNRISIVPDSGVHTIQLPTYALEIVTLDDDASSIYATVNISYLAATRQDVQSMGTTNVFNQIPEGNVSVFMTYKNLTKNDTFYLNSSISKRYIFDLTPPEFSAPIVNPSPPVPENEIQVTVSIHDPGIYPSGIPAPINYVSQMHLHYSLDSQNWETANMVFDGAAYTGRIPAQPINTIVFYYATAPDNEGNIGKSPTYTLNTFPVVVNTTPDSYIVQYSLSVLNFVWSIRVPIAAILVAYGIFWYYKKRKREISESY